MALAQRPASPPARPPARPGLKPRPLPRPGPSGLTQKAQARARLPQRGRAVSAAERAVRAVQLLQQAGQLSQEFLLRAGACGRREASGRGGGSGLHPSGPAAPHVPSPALSASAPSSRSRSKAPRAASSAASRAHSALKSGHKGLRAAAPRKSSYLRRRQGEREPGRPSEFPRADLPLPAPPSAAPRPLPQGLQVPGYGGPLPGLGLRPLHGNVASSQGCAPCR